MEVKWVKGDREGKAENDRKGRKEGSGVRMGKRIIAGERGEGVGEKASE